MSTNYYAEWKLSREVTLEMHIGKSSRGQGIETFCGLHFATIEDWKRFLKFNERSLAIKNEYGEEFGAKEFISNFVDVSVKDNYQLNWVKNHPNEVTLLDEAPEPVIPWSPVYWIDPSGKLFYGGEFS